MLVAADLIKEYYRMSKKNDKTKKNHANPSMISVAFQQFIQRRILFNPQGFLNTSIAINKPAC
jgi:hypothetical protein